MSRRSRTRPRPSDVFTPTRLPLGDTNVYAKRAEPETILARVVDRGQVPLVFGEYGVGKTSLVKKYFESEDDAGRLVHIPSARNKTIGDLAMICLEHLDYRVEAKTKKTVGDQAEAGIDIKIFGAKSQTSSGTEVESELLVRDPTDRRLLDVLARAALTIVVDEMHRAATDLRVAMADLVKAINTLGLTFPRIVLVGTAHEAQELVTLDQGVDRVIKEVEVRLMTEQEAGYIVIEGMRRLGLGLADNLGDTIVTVAARVPSIVHSICLDAADSCLDSVERL